MVVGTPILRTFFALSLALLAVLAAAPAAPAAGESIRGKVMSTEGGDLANICVTAEGASGNVLRTTASDGTYSIPVGPGDYLVRFDDCGTSSYETEYHADAFDEGSATMVSVLPNQQVTAIDAALKPLPPADDDGAPETIIDAGPPPETVETAVHFEFSSDDPAASFECSLDGELFQSCSNPHAEEMLADGPHYFAVRSVDAFGVRDPTPASVDFSVASGAPNGLITGGPDSETVRSRDVSFQFTSTDPTNSEFLCQLDDRAATPCTSPEAFTGLTNGPHTFTLVTRIREGGPADQTDAVRTFYVNVGGPEDLDPPDATIVTGPEGTVGSSGVAFGFESDEDHSTFRCALDDGPYAPCTSPHLVSGLENGEHTFRVLATDAAGNEEEEPAERTFVVDTAIDQVDPETVIDSGPSGTIHEDFATFGFSSSEANSTFECNLNEGGFAPCSSPRTLAGLVPGTYTLEVRATDAASNTDTTPASRTFTVDPIGVPADVEAPDTSFTSGPVEGETLTTRSASIAFTSTQDGSSFECRLDDDAWRRCTSPRALSGLEDGAHSFRVRAIDPAGNRDESPAVRNFSVDAAAPETTIQSGPDGLTIGTDPAEYTFASSEAGTSFECRLDAGSWGACSGADSHTISGASAGTHTFAVRAVDGVGNKDATPAVSAFTVDATDPQTFFDSGPSGRVAVVTPFSFSASEDASFECRVNGGFWEFCSSPWEPGGLGEGQHTVEVRATDGAGNVDETPVSRSFTLDTTGPNTTITSGPSGTITSGSASFSFTATEAGSEFQCQIDGKGWAPCTSPRAYSGLAEGSHTFQVRARDGVGNGGSPASRSFTVDLPSTPPPPPPPPPGPGPECAAAQSKLDSAQAGLKKAKAKLKRAKSSAAKKKAKKNVNKAKANVKKAQAAVASSC